MSGFIIQLGICAVVAIAIGVGVGWHVRGKQSIRQLEKVLGEWQVKFDQVVRQRDKFKADGAKLAVSIEAQQGLLRQHESAASKIRTEIESMREKLKSMTKDQFALREDRDGLSKELAKQKNASSEAKRQLAESETEFVKSGELYKAELAKAFEKRKSLETKLDDSKAEQESLNNLLREAKSESESVNKMLVAAQTRLDNLDELERKAIALEAENAELRHDASGVQLEVETLKRDVAELEELKVQNKELSHCLTSMENSRKQYEADAQRYRHQANESDKQSETLRVKLDDVQKNIANMAKQQEEARKHVRAQEEKSATNGAAQPPVKIDDLTEIVGIGKVFQHTLHKLGYYTFQQIANFGPADIARVNLALKENRGRMEQDDWIGQAKELYFKRHSEMVEH
jgi:predicted flap endonuclease-1-like 5' DNA nuclease